MENFRCEDCTKRKPIDEARMLDGGGSICDDCSDAYASCYRCQYYFPKEQVVLYCPGCLAHVKEDQKDRNGGGHEQVIP